jgi:hypothetical protein
MTSMQIITLVTAIVGAICGICGAVLGIINTWSQLSRNRVRLKVIPKLAYMVGGNDVMAGVRSCEYQQDLSNKGTPSRLCIEVINLSAFAVTISDAGFGKKDRNRLALIKPEVSKKSWPTRLEPHEAVMLYAAIGLSLNPTIMLKAVAYAETDCGVVCYGTTPIFQEYINALPSQKNGGIQP